MSIIHIGSIGRLCTFALAWLLFVPLAPASAMAPGSDQTGSPKSLAELPIDPSPGDIARMLQRRGAREVRVREDATAARVGVQALPNNAFTVRSYWADYTDKKGRKHVVFYGTWNFRNNFVGSGGPADVSAMAISGFNAKCWTQVSDAAVYKDYKGKVRGKGTRYLASHGRVIRSIKDRTVNHMLLSDNGIHQIDMRKDKKKKCGGRKAGSFFFEHNQSGGGWSASVSLAILSVAYSGGDALKLRKAARYNYYN